MIRMNPPGTDAAATAAPTRTRRQQAETAALGKAGPLPQTPAEISPAAMQRTLHELQVHQIELEMQNEELRLAQAELAAAQARYVDLYDLAPVGYVTLNEQGLILEANLTAASLLGVVRGVLIGQPLHRFICSEDHDSYYLHRQKLFETGKPQQCEPRMSKIDGIPFWAHLAATTSRNIDGLMVCHVVMSDITERKQADQALRIKNFVFDASMAANCFADLGGIVTEVNVAFLRIWGYSNKDGVIGKPLSHFIQDPNEAHILVSTLKGTGHWEGEFAAKRQDGSTFIADCLTTDVWDERGKVIGFQATMIDVTARKQADQALRQSEALLRATQSLSKVGGWIWDLERQEVFWTEETYRIHDFEIGAMGSDLQEYLTKSLGCCAESYQPVILAAFRRCADHGDSYDLEYPFTTATGRQLWVRTTAHAARDGQGRIVKVIGTMMDITERRQAEQTLREWNQTLECRVAERTMELQQSEARLTQLAEATFEGLLLSEDGRVFDCNAQFARIFGYELAEVIGHALVDFVAPESRAAVAEFVSNNLEGNNEFVGLREDGSTFPAEANARLRTWQGKLIRVTAVRDLTSIKRKAARLLAQQAELEQSRRLALVSEISAGIIHQLGQPLCAIGANLSVVLVKLKAAGPQGSELLEILRDVESDVARMRDTTIHLRALAHPEHPSRARIDLNEVVASALKVEWHDVATRQIRISTDYGRNLPPLMADGVQLSHVICILRRNAIEACAGLPPDRQTIAISTRLLADEGLVELCVRDAGCGILPAVMSQLFSPFFTTKTEGLGIGLRLCRTIVEAHGGRIEACNNPDGVGAMLRVLFPIDNT